MSQLYSQLLLHAPEQVEGLKRSHIVKVRLVELFLQRGQKRVFELEKQQLEGAVAFYATFLDIVRLDGIALFRHLIHIIAMSITI